MDENYCNNCQKNISTANFATHSAFCERNIKICKMCKEPIQISTEKEHLEEFHITVACDLCETVLEKWMLQQHQGSCTKRLVKCEYCNGEIPFEGYLEHFEFCSSKTEKCLLCQKYVMLKDKVKHSEIHFHKKEILSANIESEVKQNIFNELISSGQNTQEKIDTEKNYTVSSNIVTAKNDKTHLKVNIPTKEDVCAFGMSNELSKYSTVCPICKQTVSWIDYNTHLPSCATDEGKCSRCLEDVSSDKFKDHMLKDCKLLLSKGTSMKKTDLKSKAFRNEAVYMAEDITDPRDMKTCPKCQQLCSTDRIDEHIKNCCQNESTYECQYCFLKMPESDKFKHESTDCILKLELNDSDSRARREYQSIHEGAVPKNSFADMVKFQEGKCKFCKIAVNTNILKYHEESCVHQSYTCKNCNKKLQPKDCEKHNCKRKNKNKYGTTACSSYSSNTCGYNYREKIFSNPDADDAKIPCEFCGSLKPASEIILHETGCRPELVAFPKNVSLNDKVQISNQTDINQQDIVSGEKFFSSESKTNFLSCKTRNAKKYKESNLDEKCEPGEFLQSIYVTNQSENSKNHLVESNSLKESIKFVDTEKNSTDSKNLFITRNKEDKQEEREKKFSGIQKQSDDKHARNSDDEMTEMFEFISENKTDKRCSNDSDKEINTKYSKCNVLHKTSNTNLYSKMLYQVEKHLRDVHVKKNGENNENFAKNNEDDVNVYHTTQEGHTEISEDDLEKWEKWQSRRSNSS